MLPSPEIVIIGAGPAGLSAAFELAKQGMRATVLEASDQVGGISRTVNYRGYRFDIGGHRFFTKVPYIKTLWREMLQEDLLLRPRLSRIHYRGHFFDYPLKPLNAILGLGWQEALHVCLSYGRAKLFPYDKDRNLELWISNRFGYRLYDIFFKSYTEKVWGIPCHKISADWAAQRIKNLSLKKVLADAFFGQLMHRGSKAVSLINEFHYPRFGPGQMWECCAQQLVEQGSSVVYKEKAVRIRHHQAKVKSVETLRPSGEQIEYHGKHFISSMPLRELILALDPLPPDPIRQIARDLRYRDFITVMLIINRENIFPDNWLYINTPETKVGRIQNFKNWSPAMTPDPARTSLGLEYFLWQHDPEWHWPDEQLIKLAIQECACLGLIQADEVEDGRVVRMEKAYPVYDDDYRKNLEILRQYLAQFSNLHTIGRNGMHRYNNQDHSMLTGVYAARNILGEANDVWSVNTDKGYLE